MLYNYHTHTKRCRHATGEDREYVENAIKTGVKILGFSDHAPYLFDGDYYSYYRMFVNQAEDYVNSVLALKKEYKSDIEIHLGFELEYYSGYKHEREMNFLKQFPYEYLILGQHYVGGEPGGVYPPCGSGDGFLKTYVDECIEGFETGDFTYLAHPDIVGYEFSDLAIDKEYTRLLTYLKQKDIPVEINVLGITSNRWYSKRKLYELYEKVQNKVIIGIDAHTPTAISKSSYDAAYKAIEGLNLNIIEKLDF